MNDNTQQSDESPADGLLVIPDFLRNQKNLQAEREEARSRYREPPCLECGAMTPEEAESKCRCCGDKDDCHGCHLWPD